MKSIPTESNFGAHAEDVDLSTISGQDLRSVAAVQGAARN